MRIIKTGFYSKLKTGVEVKQSVPTGITEEYKIRNLCIPLSNSSWGGGTEEMLGSVTVMFGSMCN